MINLTCFPLITVTLVIVLYMHPLICSFCTPNLPEDPVVPDFEEILKMLSLCIS
jgi:hypothetical protein